jgi:acyl-[acyl carrier protein]--UDP-N-acetylglucosamine O-acyltransferase
MLGPLIGAALGAATGAIIGGISNRIQENSETEKEQSVLNLLASQYRYNGEEALTKENIEKLYNEDLTNEEIDAIRKLCKELYKNTMATEAENKTIAT